MTKKQYGNAEIYENKLAKVMARLGAQEFNFNWDRHGCWVEFCYQGQLFRFDHTIEKAKARGVDIRYGSDAFAQVVLALEDLARIVERGIYELSTWVAGMQFLPPPGEVPAYFKQLGFTVIPADVEEVKARYRGLAKEKHPDAGGSASEFGKLVEAAELAMKYFA